MDTYNHFESEIPCYRVAHDGEKVISIAYGPGKTSSSFQLITGDSVEDIQEKLGEQEIDLGDVAIPEPDPEPDID